MVYPASATRGVVSSPFQGSSPLWSQSSVTDGDYLWSVFVQWSLRRKCLEDLITDAGKAERRMRSLNGDLKECEEREMEELKRSKNQGRDGD